MLEALTIRDYALIQHLEVEVPSGLSVLSGETGAGKSIIVDALGLLMGGKAEPEAVRSGANQAEIAGIVSADRAGEVARWLETHDIAPEDGRLVLRRVVKAAGRSTAYVQATPVTLAQMAELARHLFDFHGQHENQSLLANDRQRSLLDRYADAEELAAECAHIYTNLVELRTAQAELADSERGRARDQEMWRFAIEEINAARLQPEEDRELGEEHARLVNHERLALAVEEAVQSLAADGALAAVREGYSSLKHVAALDPQLEATARLLESVLYELEEVSEKVTDYRERLTFDPQRLQDVEARIGQLHALKRKYGEDAEAILGFAREAQLNLERSEGAEEEAARLGQEVAATEQALRDVADRLTTARKKASVQLQSQVQAQLRTLGMQKARFEVQVQPRVRGGRPAHSPTGKDQVEFLFGANVGEEMKPLRAIGSGGELSRVMLAVKSILADNDLIDTLIFDEVDAGIGGEVALAVAEKLQQLAGGRQVLCITHLAAIAAHADNHFTVQKAVRGGRTTTTLTPVEGDERVLEIARMLAGDKQAEVSRTHARELLKRCGRVRHAEGNTVS